MMKGRNKTKNQLIYEVAELRQRIAGLEKLEIQHNQVEETLRQREEKYRTILESIEEGYYEVDLAGNFTFLNDSMCRIWGYPKEELMGMNHRQFTDQENAQRLFHDFNRAYKTGQPGKIVDYEIIRKDGAKKCVETSFSIIRNSSGKAIGFRGIIRDITERKKAEEALQKSEEKYRNILESIQEGYSEIDLVGNFTFVNNVTCRHLGYTKQELIGMNYRQYTSEENAKKIKKIYIEVYKTGKPTDLTDHELISKDGATATYELSVSLIRNAEGNPIGFRQTSRDITQRKKAEEALQKSEEKYRTILENIEDGYYEVDLAGNFTFFNDSMCRILGYPREELMGMNNRQYTDQENAKRLFQAFNKVYTTGEPGKGFDHELIRKDGTKRYVEASISLKKDSAGCPTGFRGIVRDITERKRFERVLHQERETFYSILQKEPYGALLISTDETFLYLNPEFTAITGYTIKDVPNGREWFRKAYPDLEYRHKAIAMWKADITPRKGVERVWSVVCKNGEVKEIEFRLTFLDDGRIIAMLSDVTERKRTEEELAYRATHDLLTGLPNRMLFKDRFSIAMAQAQRAHKKLAVIFLDLDRFKEVNDTLGHNVGDRLLCAVGNRLAELVRKTDTVARIGGDEFLLLLAEIDGVEDATAIARKVLESVQDPLVVNGHQIFVTASIGIAFYPDDGNEVDTLVNRADEAMYNAKQKGFNTSHPYLQSAYGESSE